MVYFQLMIFSIRQLSALGVWQAGAELSGTDELRRRADRHRYLQMEAASALQSQFRTDLARLVTQLPSLVR